MKKIKFGLMRSLGFHAAFALINDLIINKMAANTKEEKEQKTMTLSLVAYIKDYLKKLIKLRNKDHVNMNIINIEETEEGYTIKIKNNARSNSQ